MPALRDIQAAFLNDIYTGGKSSAVYLNKSCSAERLDIFYNNTFLGLTDVLAAIYPVLQKIVGEKFFSTTAHFYIEAYSQNTGNRYTYGRELALFLNSYEPADAWPYLSDIAAIEWAYFQSSIAENESAIDFNKLTDLIQAHSKLILSLHPGVHYIKLNYNSLEIWQEHQKEKDKIKSIKLQKTPQTVLVWRDQNDKIFIEKISEQLQKLLILCQKGTVFSQAMLHASSGLQDFAGFQQEFAGIVSSGVFVYKGGKQ